MVTEKGHADTPIMLGFQSRGVDIDMEPNRGWGGVDSRTRKTLYGRGPTIFKLSGPDFATQVGQYSHSGGGGTQLRLGDERCLVTVICSIDVH